MNKTDKTLLIMAAGMGSRFGGLKQIEPVGPNGEFIIDYSIYDAIKAGYNKVVIIIKEEIFEIFRETIGKRIENKIKLEYAFQRLEDLPDGYKVPEGRTKPWGTVHAILAAKDLIHEQFTIINADDFYGSDSFIVSSKFIDNNQLTNNFAVTGYMIKNVLSKNGSVKRGVCKDENGILKLLLESSVDTIDGKIIAKPLDGSEEFQMQPTDLVSMNMLTFTPEIFDYLESNFPKFLEKHSNDLLTCEYLIPDAVYQMILEGKAIVHVLSTTSIWYGVTHREDKDEVVKSINDMIKNNEYPKNLWQ